MDHNNDISLSIRSCDWLDLVIFFVWSCSDIDNLFREALYMSCDLGLISKSFTQVKVTWLCAHCALFL